MRMKRRDFLKAGIAVAGGAVVVETLVAETLIAETLNDGDSVRQTDRHRFRLNYAPHFGMFKHLAGENLTDQLKFAADQGYTAWEDRVISDRPIDLQNRIARTMETLGMRMGVFAVSERFRDATHTPRGSNNQGVLRDLRNSIDVAKRVNARWMTVDLENLGAPVVGAPVEREDQRLACVELLKRCAELLEPHSLVMVLEPSNWQSVRRGCSADEIPRARDICGAVDSPSCKLLFDLYHQHSHGGDVLSQIDSSWPQIAYFQCGDSRGRKEPGTGEIDYAGIFRHIDSRGFTGIVGMEHGNSLPGTAGDRAVIDVYVRVDRF